MGDGRVHHLIAGAYVRFQRWRDRSRRKDLSAFDEDQPVMVAKLAVLVESESLKGGLREVVVNRRRGRARPRPFHSLLLRNTFYAARLCSQSSLQ